MEFDYAKNHNELGIWVGNYITNYYDIHTLEDLLYVQKNKTPGDNYKNNGKRNIYIIAELCSQWGGCIKKTEQMILKLL